MHKHSNSTQKIWRREDRRLLRAARRIIRLYDLDHHQGCFYVKAESLAEIIAEELNKRADESSS